MLSGSTSKSATATTTPPVSAIRVGSECASRRPRAPPAKVATTVASGEGDHDPVPSRENDNHSHRSAMIGAVARAEQSTDWSQLAIEALGEPGRRAGGARRAVVELLARQDCCLSAQEIAEQHPCRGRSRRHGERLPRARPALHRAGLVQRIELGRRRRALRGDDPGRRAPPSRRLRSLPADHAVRGPGARAGDRTSRRQASTPRQRPRRRHPRRLPALRAGLALGVIVSGVIDDRKRLLLALGVTVCLGGALVLAAGLLAALPALLAFLPLLAGRYARRRAARAGDHGPARAPA